jgi:Cytochrome C oxidase, cbb3-type, subunit III
MRNLRYPLPIVAILVLAGCRQDMHDQPKFKPLAKSDFFTDLRSSRPLVEGTVARGQLHENTYLYTGTIGNGATPGNYMPFPVTREVLSRGRERFNIYCSPCHSRLGDGQGMVPSRGFAKIPPSFHIPRLQKAPLGYFFDVMTHGFGIMPDYAAQIQPEDRWAIVAYIRALQLSQNAPAADIPAGQQIPSPAPKLRGDPPSGATLPEIEPASAGKGSESTNMLERSK